MMKVYVLLGAAVGLWLLLQNVDISALQSRINTTIAGYKDVIVSEVNAIKQKASDSIASMTQGSK